MAPRPGFEPGIPYRTSFPGLRNTRLCDLGKYKTLSKATLPPDFSFIRIKRIKKNSAESRDQKIKLLMHD